VLETPNKKSMAPPSACPTTTPSAATSPTLSSLFDSAPGIKVVRGMTQITAFHSDFWKTDLISGTLNFVDVQLHKCGFDKKTIDFFVSLGYKGLGGKKEKVTEATDPNVPSSLVLSTVYRATKLVQVAVRRKQLKDKRKAKRAMQVAGVRERKMLMELLDQGKDMGATVTKPPLQWVTAHQQARQQMVHHIVGSGLRRSTRSTIT